MLFRSVKLRYKTHSIILDLNHTEEVPDSMASDAKIRSTACLLLEGSRVARQDKQPITKVYGKACRAAAAPRCPVKDVLRGTDYVISARVPLL